MKRVVGLWLAFVLIAIGCARGAIEGDTSDTAFLGVLASIFGIAAVVATRRRLGREAFYGIRRRSIR